jgi:hypothetical protein
MESLIEHAKPNEDLNSLTEEFQVWLDANGLPQKSANELLIQGEAILDEAQWLFLVEFCRRWEVAAMEMAISS